MRSLSLVGLTVGLLFLPFRGPDAQSPPKPDPSERAKVVAGYCAAWNEPDGAKRASLLREVWDTEGEYRDPTPVSVKGRDALSRHIDGFLKQFVGGQIRCSAPQSHHQSARFTWQIFAANDSLLVSGMDYAEFATDGRLRRIVGFFGPPPLIEKRR